MSLQMKLKVETTGKVLLDTANGSKSKTVHKKRLRSEDDTENNPMKLSKKSKCSKSKVQSSIEESQMFENRSTQTELTSENTDINDTEYWKQCATECQKSLEKSLTENRTLVGTYEALKAETALMEEMVQEAKELAKLLQNTEDES